MKAMNGKMMDMLIDSDKYIASATNSFFRGSGVGATGTPFTDRIAMAATQSAQYAQKQSVGNELSMGSTSDSPIICSATLM